MSNKQYKILVVRYGTIGDTIFALPFLRELRNYCKEGCIIDAVSDDNSRYILESSGYVDNIISHQNLKIKKFSTAINILKTYDKIYYLRKATTLSLLAFLAGIKERVGLKIKGNMFLTKKIFYDEDKHVIDLYLDILKNDGIEVNNSKLENIFNNLNCDININNKFVAIQAFSRAILKDWSVDNWKVVVNHITENLGLDVVLLGSDKDFEQYELMADNSKVHNLAGKTSMQETISFINKSSCFIGIDSGLIHVAATLKKKSILIHGSTSLTHWAPQNDDCVVVSKNYECSPCCFMVTGDKKTDCIYPKCMYAISPDKVIDKINTLIN